MRCFRWHVAVIEKAKQVLKTNNTIQEHPENQGKGEETAHKGIPSSESTKCGTKKKRITHKEFDKPEVLPQVLLQEPFLTLLFPNQASETKLLSFNRMHSIR